jgi:hypothetical protein
MAAIVETKLLVYAVEGVGHDPPDTRYRRARGLAVRGE